MGLFKSKPNYLEIGRNGTAEQFFQMVQKSKSDPAGYFEIDRRDLIEGAIQAFREGRPENLQTVIVTPEALRNQHCPFIVPTALFKAMEGSSDKPADIILALQKVPEQDRQKTLNSVLNTAITNDIGRESFFAVLLEAGAEANAKIGGYAGGLLVTAAYHKHPLSVIELLHDKGASFEDALHTMHLRGFQTADIDRLKHYQEKVEGKQAAAETSCQPGMDKAVMALLETMLHMQEQIAELTKKVDRLTAPPSPANANDPAAPPQKGPALKFPKI